MQRIAERISFRFSNKPLKLIGIITLQAVLLTACVSVPPYEEYTLAREALRAAEESDSAKFSPRFWLEAESSYREAEAAYKVNNFSKAKSMFIESMRWSEKAENQTRLKKFESGDVFQ